MFLRTEMDRSTPCSRSRNALLGLILLLTIPAASLWGQGSVVAVSDWAPGPENALPESLCPGPIMGVFIDVPNFWIDGDASGLYVTTHSGTESALRRVAFDGSSSRIAELPTSANLCDGFAEKGSLGPEYLHFFVNDGASGFGGADWELWASDRTAAGTQLAAELLGEHYVDFGPNFQGERTFVLGSGPSQIWTSDGTLAGTHELVDLVPAPTFIESVETSADLLFIAAHADGFRRLWTSDGTQAGTELIWTLDHAHSITDMVAFGDGVFLFVRRHQSPFRSSLWFSDGTSAGTVEILQTPGFNLSPWEIEVVGDLLFFAASDDSPSSLQALWRSDGTAAGTFSLMQSFSSAAGRMIALDDRLLFTFADTTTDLGAELYVSDGTAEGTQLLRDINPGSGSSSAREFVRRGGEAYFTADDGGGGLEIWRTDGTPEGTELYAETLPGPGDLEPEQLTVAAGQLFFVGNSPEEGHEIYLVDGPGAVAIPALGDYGRWALIVLLAWCSGRVIRRDRELHGNDRG